MVLLFAAGCNIFEWTYAEEKSNDYEVIMASADAYLRNRNYDKALALYERALEIRSNASQAFCGRINARLMKQTDSRSVIQVFPAFFSTSNCTDPIFTSYSILSLTDLLRTITACNKDFNNILQPYPLSDGYCNTNSVSFQMDMAFIRGLAAVLFLLDNNTNAIPRESIDIFQVSCGFKLNSPTGLQPAEATNALNTIIRVTNTLYACSNTLFIIADNQLIQNALIEPFDRFRNNIHTLFSNTMLLMTNIEAQL